MPASAPTSFPLASCVARCARAFRAGRIVFSGVGKTEDEMAEALAAGIWRFNVESRTSCSLLQRVARARKASSRNAAVRINPDVDAGTHEKISTGKAENKFGVTHRRGAGAGSAAPAN